MEKETPRLNRLLEDTLIAPFAAPAIFTRLSQSPAPGYGLLAANVAAYYGLAFAVNLARSLLAGGSTLGPGALAAASAVALALALSLSFAAAGLLHALCAAAGGMADFRRSYQLISLLSSMAVIQSLLNWSPLWALPVPWATLLAIEGCRRLHQAPLARSWAVFGAVGLLALGSQWLARRELARVLAQTDTLRRSAEQVQDAAAGLQALQRALPLLPGATEALSPPSSLDLISDGVKPLNPGAQSVSASPIDPETASLQAHALEDQASRMMDSILPMLSNPAITRMLSPKQKKQFDEIAKMLEASQARQKSGKPLTAAEEAESRAQTLKLQAMLMNVMMEKK